MSKDTTKTEALNTYKQEPPNQILKDKVMKTETPHTQYLRTNLYTIRQN